MTETHAEWRVDDMIEAGLVQPSRNRLLLIGALCVKPCRDLGFDLRAACPTVGGLFAVGANNPAGWVCEPVDAKSARDIHVPSALIGRRFLLYPRDQGAEVDSSIVHLDSKVLEQIDCYIAPNLVMRNVLSRHEGDRFACVAGFGQRSLGEVKPARAFKYFAASLVV